MQAPDGLAVKIMLALSQLVRGQPRDAVAFGEDCLGRRADVRAKEVQLDGLVVFEE